jgi:hypothetical protein
VHSFNTANKANEVGEHLSSTLLPLLGCRTKQWFHNDIGAINEYLWPWLIHFSQMSNLATATQDIAAIAIPNPGGTHDAGKVHPQQLLDS